MTKPTLKLKSVKIDDVPFGTRFKWSDRWYEWHQLTKNLNKLARIVLPNAPDGKTSYLTGSTPPPGTLVDVFDDQPVTLESNPAQYFDDFGDELDTNPIGAGLPRSTGGL